VVREKNEKKEDGINKLYLGKMDLGTKPDSGRTLG